MKSSHKTPWTAAIFIVLAVLAHFITAKELSARQLPCKTVTIADKQWMAENLNTANYRNGDPIPQVDDPVAWSLLTTVAWCYYKNKSSNSSGFTAIPSGFRSSSGSYALLGSNSSFWTSTENNAWSAWYREIFNSYSAVYRISTSKTQGFAVRCVND